MENLIINEVEELIEVAQDIELIGEDDKLTMVLLKNKINELIDRINSVQPSGRDRGPKSTRQMTEDDARLILLGELKDKSHTECSKTLGLSYGQIYSARNGFTFKTIYKESKTSAN